MTQPLVAKSFEMAERLGMLAFDLMASMTVRELLWWSEYDVAKADKITRADQQYALLMAKLDIIAGAKKAYPANYLPKVKRRRKSKAQIKANFDLAVANSARLDHGG